MDAPSQILIVGDWSGGPFEPLRTWAASLSGVTFRSAATASEVAVLVGDGEFVPSLAVVAQRWPEEFAPSDVHRLLALAPLARWVCCLGPWCEGVGRTGLSWPQAAQIPARLCADRLAFESEVCAGRRLPLALTGSRDEAFAFDLPERPAVSEALAVVVLSPDRGLAELMAAICCRSGCAVADAEGAPPDVILWDADPDCPGRSLQFDALRAQHPTARVIRVTGACDLPGEMLPKLSLVAELPKVLRK